MEEGPMNDVIRKQVRKLYTKLISKLEPRGHILDLLFEKEIINFDQNSEIEKLENRDSRCRKLLLYLFESVLPNAFVVFRESLAEEYQEIIDQIDEASSNETETLLVNWLNKKKEVLLRCIDCNCRFLTQLKASNILNHEIKQEIEAEKTPCKQNMRLLQWLTESINKATINAFISVLRETEQEHVANLLTGNTKGKYPMSDEQTNRLNRIKLKLLDTIDSKSGLCECLLAKESVSKFDYYDRIMPVKGMYARNDAIVEAILRRSTQDLDGFADSLKETNQPHVAQYLFEGEVIGIHVNTDRPEEDEDLTKIIRHLTIEDRNGTTHRNGFRELHELGAPAMGAVPNQSILVYVYVDTLEAAVGVLQYMKDGRMTTIMENLLNTAAQDGEKGTLTVTNVRMESEDEIVCFDFIKSKVQECDPDEFLELLASSSSPTTKDRTNIEEMFGVSLVRGEHTNSATHQEEKQIRHVSEDTMNQTREHSVSRRSSKVAQINDAYWVGINFDAARNFEHFQSHAFRIPITFENKVDFTKELDKYSPGDRSGTLRKSAHFVSSGTFSDPKFSVDFEILERCVDTTACVEIFNVRCHNDGCCYTIHKISMTQVRFMKNYDLHEHYGFDDDDNWFEENHISRIARKLAKLNHSNVVKYLNFWKEGVEGEESLYIQMEVGGEHTLQDEIDHGELCRNDDRIWKIFHGIVSGLAYIHDLDVVHGELKTTNVFVDIRGNAKIGNFHISRNYLKGRQSGCYPYILPGMPENGKYLDLICLGGILSKMCCHPHSSEPTMRSLGYIQKDQNKYKEEIVAWCRFMRSQDHVTAKDVLNLLDTISSLNKNGISFFTIGLRFQSLLNRIISSIHEYVGVHIETDFCSLFGVRFSYDNELQYNCRLHMAFRIRDIPNIHWLSLFRKMKDTSIEFVSAVQEYRMILARVVAETEVENVRLYSEYETFQKSSLSHEENFTSCSFDVVLPYSETALMHTAEVIFIVSEVSKAGSKKCCVYLNHTSLIKAIMLHCEIPEEYHTLVFSVLQVSEDCSRVKISSTELLKKLVNVLPLGRECLEKFVNFIAIEETVDRAMIKLNDVISERNEAGLLAKEALDEVAQLDSLLQDTVDIILTLGFVNDIRCYAGIIFRVVSSNQQVTGGRYDALLASCKPGVESKDEKLCVRHMAAGFTISSVRLFYMSTFFIKPTTQKNIVSDNVIVAHKNGLFSTEQFKVAVTLWKEGIPTLLYDKNIHGTIESSAKYCKKHGVRFIVFVENPGDSCEVFDSKDISTSNIEHPHLIASYLKQTCVGLHVTLGSLSNISKSTYFELRAPPKDSKETLKTISQLPAREPIRSSEFELESLYSPVREFASITYEQLLIDNTHSINKPAPELGCSEPLFGIKLRKSHCETQNKNEISFPEK